MKDSNYFKEKLYNHTLPVNEGLWSAIEAQLPPEQKQKRFPVFWMTLFGTTLLGGALMIGVFHQTSTTPGSRLENNAAMATSLNTQISSTEIDATGSSATVSDEIATTEETATNTTKSETGIGAKTTLSSKTTNATVKTGIIQPNKNTNPLNNNNKAINNSIESGIENEAAAQPSNQTITSATNIITAGDNDFEMASLPYRNTKMTAALPLADMSQTTSTLNLMPGIAPDPNCYKFGDIGPHYALSVDVMGGFGFSPKSYEENGGETADYISAREDTENGQYAWSMGARLNLHHRSGFTGRLGLQYTQVGDVFDYSDSMASQTTTRIDSFFAADGTFLYTEVTQVLIDGTLVKKIHNTYRYLDIPLLVGYEMRFGRNIVMVNAGPVFNLTHTYEGQILDSMLHPRSITPGSPGAIDIYKTNLGMSIYLGAGILFPLSDRFSALIEPSYLYRLKPVTLNSYELKEKRGYASLNLGIRYHIN